MTPIQDNQTAYDKVEGEWRSIAEAIAEVQRDARDRTPSDNDWFDPTDAKWWGECPQIGDLDPTECARQYVGGGAS